MLRNLVNIPRILRRPSAICCQEARRRQFSKSQVNQFKFHGKEYEWDEITPMGWCLLVGFSSSIDREGSSAWLKWSYILILVDTDSHIWPGLLASTAKTMEGRSFEAIRDRNYTRTGWFATKVCRDDRDVLDYTDPAFYFSLDDLDEMEYCPVRVHGKFLHEKELVLGPRSLVKKGRHEKSGGGVMTQQDSSTGYLIITPFKLEGREWVLLYHSIVNEIWW